MPRRVEINYISNVRSREVPPLATMSFAARFVASSDKAFGNRRDRICYTNNIHTTGVHSTEVAHTWEFWLENLVRNFKGWILIGKPKPVDLSAECGLYLRIAEATVNELSQIRALSRFLNALRGRFFVLEVKLISLVNALNFLPLKRMRKPITKNASRIIRFGKLNSFKNTFHATV